MSKRVNNRKGKRGRSKYNAQFVREMERFNANLRFKMQGLK